MTDQCPECHYSAERHRGTLMLPCHAKTCSRIDLDSARYYCRKLAESEMHWYRHFVMAQQRSALWEGKFRTVKHENNQLRKKLKP